MSMLVELALAVASGGGVGAIAAHLTARRRARASERIAATIHDERVAPPLIDRIGVLETRIDARDLAIEELRGQAAECEQGRLECKTDLARLEEQLERVRQNQMHIRHAIRSTPPGSWKLDDINGGIDDEPEAAIDGD